MEMPSYDLIVAAVGGDDQAMAKILKHHELMINEQCGGNKKLRRQVSEALRETILHDDLVKYAEC